MAAAALPPSDPGVETGAGGVPGQAPEGTSADALTASADTPLGSALAMLRRRDAHSMVVVDAGGAVLGVLALKETSTPISDAITAAGDLAQLAQAARSLRAFAGELLADGMGARQVTELISYLNEALAERLVRIVAERHGRDLAKMCWLAFGSQGRGEQTLVTDQDNGLVFESEDAAADRPRWLAFSREVNEGLAACGYSLCRGQVMAGNPACCLTAQEWRERFDDWIEHGSPQDLLNACVYFDLRPLAGRLLLAAPLRAFVSHRARAVPRFLKQLADNALRNPPPLSWLGGVETRRVGGRPMLDLKHHGTMLFVDAARLYALAQGIEQTGTRERLTAVGRQLKVPAHESEAWVRAFEFLQLLRLQSQLARGAQAPGGVNMVDLSTLNDIDRRLLKEALRQGQRLQQRLQLDYQR